MAHRIALSFVALAWFALGCGEEEAPASDLADVRIYLAKSESTAGGPYDGVDLLRIAIEAPGGAGSTRLVRDTFVYYQPGGSKGLPEIPFGDNLRFLVEGWTQGEGGGPEFLVSRGRSTYVDIDANSESVPVNVMLSRVNEFAFTTAPGKNGLFASSMSQGRIGHTVTRLHDGRVLIVGGARMKDGVSGDFKSADDLAEVYATAEIYDPAKGTFTPLSSAMAHPRAFHTATLLPDDTVLIAGGLTEISGSRQTLGLFQVFNPALEAFEDVLPLQLGTTRAGHTATVLDGDGHVLFAGGFARDQNGTVLTVGTLEVITPGPEPKVLPLGSFATARAFHTATRVPLGPEQRDAVVFMGGENDSGALDTVESYFLSPAGLDKDIKTMPGGARTRHTATFIADRGLVHVAGGFRDKAHADAVQKIDGFLVAGKEFHGENFNLLQARGGHTAILLEGNTVLLAGGFADGQPLASAEVIYEYLDRAQNQYFIDRGGVGALHTPRGGAAGVLLDNGTALLTGGAGTNGAMVTAGEYFNPL